MLLAFMVLQKATNDKSFFQVKNATRDVSLTDGTYYKESTKLFVQVIDDKAPLVYYYAIPFHFWQRVSFHSARNIRTGQQLQTKLVRIDEYHADLFYIEIELDALPTSGERMQLQVEYHVADGARYVNKFTSLMTNHSGTDGAELKEKLKADRKLSCIFAAQIPSIYDISTQKTTVKLPTAAYNDHKTSFSPVQYKADKIEIGPNEYLTTLEFENITVNYSAASFTLNVSCKRQVYPSGLPIRVGVFENQLGRVHVVDTLNFTNTDPRPEGLRESRLNIHYYKQQPNRMLHNLTVIIPKATNIKVYDRVGKVASRKIIQQENQTVLVIQPRHEIFGQQKGQIVIEYDINVMQQSSEILGLVMSATPKLNETAFYNKVEVCVYPPSGAQNVSYFAGFPIEFEHEDTATKSLDIWERQGKCFGRGLSSDAYAARNFATKFQLSLELVQTRFIKVGTGIACFVGAAWLLRVLL